MTPHGQASWPALFAELSAILATPASVGTHARACARCLDGHRFAVADPALREDLDRAALGLERYARTGAPAIEGFDRMVHADGSREHMFAFVLRDVERPETARPLIAHGRVDPSVASALAVLRSREFVGVVANRIGIPAPPDALMQSRVQAVEVIHTAGLARYAVFADLLDGYDEADSDVRGGLMLSSAADDFLGADAPLMHRLFPETMARLATLGVLSPAILRRLFGIFLALHDTAGHSLPWHVHHPTKAAVGRFLLDPVEEFGADAQFLWSATSDRTRPFLARILTPAEREALPLVWLLKRLGHYIGRARFASDPDSRTAILQWHTLVEAGALVDAGGGRFRLVAEALPAAAEQMLDAWLAVEAHLPLGPTAYAEALVRLGRRDGDATAWSHPAGWLPAEPAPASAPIALPARERLRIGVVNLMPDPADYEATLLDVLAVPGTSWEPKWIRLDRWRYAPADRAHVARYQTWDEARAGNPLDGLIITGAAVERLPFDRVEDWDELAAVIDAAHGAVRSVLGLCWGGMAVLHARLGVDKQLSARKLFGDYLLHNCDERDPLLSSVTAQFWCPQSRFAALTDALLEPWLQQHALRVLARMSSGEPVIVAAPDHRLVAHLGHPEYAASRFEQEYRRDRERRVEGVLPPENVALPQPVPYWREDGKRFFSAWLDLLGTA